MAKALNQLYGTKENKEKKIELEFRITRTSGPLLYDNSYLHSLFPRDSCHGKQKLRWFQREQRQMLITFTRVQRRVRDGNIATAK
jgi:hypothetical protein